MRMKLEVNPIREMMHLLILMLVTHVALECMLDWNWKLLVSAWVSAESLVGTLCDWNHPPACVFVLDDEI